MKEKDSLPWADTVPGQGHRARGGEQGGFQSPACTTLLSGWPYRVANTTAELRLSPATSNSEVLVLNL